MSYIRKITASEASRHYITINKRFRGIFPDPYTKFKLIADNEIFEVEIDSQGRIWSGQLTLKFKFLTGDQFRFTVIRENVYKVDKINRDNFQWH